MLKYAPYSLDVAPCDVLSPNKTESYIKGACFQSIEDIHKETTLNKFFQDVTLVDDASRPGRHIWGGV
jgi:hypothetical protein